MPEPDVLAARHRAEIGVGRWTEEDVGEHDEQCGVHRDFGPAVPVAHYDVEGDPQKGEPAPPVVAAKHGKSSDHSEQAEQRDPDDFGLERTLEPFRRVVDLSLIHISEPTRRTPISYA